MTVKEKVTELLCDLSGLATIHIEDSLQLDVGLDSLGMVTLLIEIEEAFHIELEESDMNPFDLKTVSDVVALITRYLEANNEEIG